MRDEINYILSVIVPCYNVEQYIERCARSLFEQTICKRYPVEFIFVNDCTPDHSMEVLHRVMADYPHITDHIRIIDLEKNGGLFMARHHGIMAAQGEYIAHIDSDDWIDREMFEEMVDTALLKNADVVWCGSVHECLDGRRPIGVAIPFESPDAFLRQAIHDERIWCIWGKIYRRTIAQQAEEKIPMTRINFAEDLMRICCILPLCNILAIVPKQFYHYCENPTSLSGKNTPQNYLPDTVKVGDFISKILPAGYEKEILKYKRMILWKTIWVPTSSSYQMYKNLWPEAKKGLLFDDSYKLVYRFFLWLSTISYSCSVRLFHTLLKIQQKLKKA